MFSTVVVLIAVGHSVYHIISAMWLAHESEPTSLAAFGLAAITQGIFYRIVISGMQGGQATFTSQAFGAKQFRLCYVYMYRQ